ncbi:MAG: potassium channel family protein [Verrucomicrobiota bacterium]
MEFTIKFTQLFVWSLYLVGPILLTLTSIVVVLGQIVTRIEKWGKFDGLYWSLVTATTVGYGDIRPLKKISKILSMVIAMSGIILTGFIVAITVNAASIVIEEFTQAEKIEEIKESLK